MRKRELEKRIRMASKCVYGDIAGFASRGGKFAGGLAAEGYNGGYRDALQDVLLVMNDVSPCIKPRFWERPEE